jgi:hypothetical protein
LNLQHASVVVNMDLPWNPAVLEQRIGRVHRLGQRQPVRVVNFVAQGTIEEGMLSVLRFKRSLFAGVLDGGEKDVFLGGSRLSKFMETVEKATSAIPESTLEEAEESARLPTQTSQLLHGRDGRTKDKHVAVDAGVGEAEPAPASDAWSGLLQAGMALLQQLTRTPRTDDQQRDGSHSIASFVQRDERTGEPFLKLPVPPPEVLDQALRAVGRLLDGLRK